jgi:integrase
MHPDLRARVSDTTFERYGQTLAEFCSFLELHHMNDIEDIEHLEEAIRSFRDFACLTKSKHTNLLAALYFTLPRLKRQLCETKEALRGRDRSEPTDHTVPTTRAGACLFAAHIAAKGRPRLGAAHVIQTETGLRPSELLNIMPDHVLVPTTLFENITIRLGAVVSTKAKREQFVLVHPEKQLNAWWLLKRLKDNTPQDERLIPYSYWQYRESLKSVDAGLKLNLGIGPHSGRAGYATEGVASGEDLKAIQNGGRWLSESSFRIYIDVVGALRVQSAVGLQGQQQALDFCSLHILEYLAEHKLAADNGFTKAQQLCRSQGATVRAAPNARLTLEGKPIRSARAPSRPQRERGESLARGRVAKNVAQHNEQCSDSGPATGSASTPKGKGRGKSKTGGRARLLIGPQKASIW